MAEAYVATLDAYVHGSVRSGKVKAKRALQLPWYIRDPEKPKKGLSGKALHDAIDLMMARLSKGPTGG